MSTYTSYDDVVITEDHKDFLMEAGASSYFDQFISFDPESAGLSRHMVRDKIRREIFHGELDGKPEEYSHPGGGFFSAIWNGDLFLAYRRADLHNQPLMLACFGDHPIIENGSINGHDRDYIRSLVEQKSP